MSDPLKPLTPRQREHLSARVEAYAAQLGARGRDYLARRGLLEMAEPLRFGEVVHHLKGDEQYAGRLAIPTLSARGTPVGITYRCMEAHDCKELGHGKYLNTPNYPSRLYNIGALQRAGEVICIAEGQLDAATLEVCGLVAVAVPGANAWRHSSHRLFQGFGRVQFFADTDDKGSSMNLFRKIRQGIPTAELMTLPDGYDVNSYFVEHGAEGINALCAESYSGSTEDNTLDDLEVVDERDDDEPPF